MDLYVFASGSKGNCCLVTSGSKAIIIDLGINYKHLIEKLNETPYKIEDIQAYLFTHEHSDHIKGISSKFDESLFYTSLGTLPNVSEDHLLEHYHSYNIGGFKVTVLPTSHDATNPIGFVVEDEHSKLVYMTDTGYISTKNFEYMKDATYYFIESNYNYKMLMGSNRPEYLKLRIAGDCGHLSNEESADCICHLVGEHTKEICLAHLSQECNTHELALSSYQAVFDRNEVSLEHIKLIAADQYQTVKFGDSFNED